MAFSKSRSLTLLLALAFLSSNLISLALTHQLPDDPYNLARNYGWYLHFAGVISVFGVIGCLREHAQSLLLFAHYLTLDTLLSSIPRLLLLTTFSLSPFTNSFCSPTHNTTVILTKTQTAPIQGSPSSWSPQACTRVLYLFQLSIAASVIAATVLQFIGALYVRSYALGLWKEECEADAAMQIEDPSLSFLETGFRDAKPEDDSEPEEGAEEEEEEEQEGNWRHSLETITEGSDESDDEVWGGYMARESTPAVSVSVTVRDSGVMLEDDDDEPRPAIRRILAEVERSCDYTPREPNFPPEYVALGQRIEVLCRRYGATPPSRL